MINLLLSLLITALSILLVGEVIPGIEVVNFTNAVIAAIVLGIINITLKPLLFILTLPINILTLGLFSFLLNGFFFYFVSELVSGFSVNGFWAAIFGSIIVSLITSAFNSRS
ncbi:MAG: phage holin family protein [Candidatus Paceibacterota bacterium]